MLASATLEVGLMALCILRHAFEANFEGVRQEIDALKNTKMP
jgi:hypothetical protein